MDKKLLIAGVIMLFIISACTSGTGKETPEKENFAGKTSESAVTIDLEPHQFENGVLEIDISLNTHTIDMSGFDLKKQVKLVIGEDEYYPVSAPSLGGHHNSGTLRFEIPEEPGEHMIIITGIPDVAERIFKWEAN